MATPNPITKEIKKLLKVTESQAEEVMEELGWNSHGVSGAQDILNQLIIDKLNLFLNQKKK